MLDQGPKISKCFPHLSHCFGKQHSLIYLCLHNLLVFYHDEKLANNIFVMDLGAHAPVDLPQSETKYYNTPSTPSTMVKLIQNQPLGNPKQRYKCKYHPRTTVELQSSHPMNHISFFICFALLISCVLTEAGYSLIRIKAV